jgi:hypothetical protein
MIFIMSEREGFLTYLHSSPHTWPRIRFGPEWTSQQIEALLRPHARGFRFNVLREEFEDGVAFTIRSNDYFETPVYAASFENQTDTPRELTLFLRNYVMWLRWAADELERLNKDLFRNHPHPHTPPADREDEGSSDSVKDSP